MTQNAMAFSLWRRLLLLAVAASLSACATVLPGEGPTAESILLSADADGQAARKAGYVIVPVSARVVETLGRYGPTGLRRVFGAGSPSLSRSRIGVGDVIQVHVWEASADGLFSTDERKSTQFPPMKVDRRGRVTIPFVGAVKAAGYTPYQLQERIRRRLKGKAISPQVLVTIVRHEANSVIVNGDVNKPGRYELSLKGDRVLDVIAMAGGASAPARETVVTVIRKGRKGWQNLKTVIDDPRENIYVRPGDQVYLSHNPQTYTAFGAVEKKGEYPFNSYRLSLLEAVARAGGLVDERANAGGVFLFRYEDSRLVRRLADSGRRISRGGRTPVIYVLDMSRPEAFFLAQKFQMRDNDVIYVANSLTTEFHKFLDIVNKTTSAIQGNLNLRDSF